MRTKISKVAKDLNVGVNTAVEFLRKHNIEVDEGNPNARIDSDAVDLLMQEFSNDKTAKDAAEGFSKRREHKKEKPAKTPERTASAPVKTGPVILGTIDLDNLKSGMKAATEPAVDKSKAAPAENKSAQPAKPAAPAPQAPKPEPRPEAEPAQATKPAQEPGQEVKPQPAPKAEPACADSQTGPQSCSRTEARA